MVNETSKSITDAIMWVSRPDLTNKMLKSVMANSELEIIDVNDKDLNDVYGPTGKPVYEFDTVVLDSGFFPTKVETICVPAVIIANTDSDDDLLDNVADILLNCKSSIVTQ